jgi:hypothetical protein
MKRFTQLCFAFAKTYLIASSSKWVLHRIDHFDPSSPFGGQERTSIRIYVI